MTDQIVKMETKSYQLQEKGWSIYLVRVKTPNGTWQDWQYRQSHVIDFFFIVTDF